MAEISIPGDPGGLSGLGSRLGSAADQIGAVQSRISSHGLEGAWSGAASDAFASTLGKLPGELEKAAQAFDDAGRALGTFSAKLSELQQKAAWYNRQIEGAQRDLAAAETRHRDAETDLRTAHVQHDSAGDPASRHAAQGAVLAGESRVGEAFAQVEESSSRIASLKRAGGTLRHEYDDAVRSCCGALDSARHAGSHSFLGAIAEHVKQMGGYVEGAAAVTWRGAKELEDDFEKEVGAGLKALDDNWGRLRADLSDASDYVGLLGITALAVAMIPGVDIAAAVVFAGVGIVTGAISGLTFAGDGIEALRGKREKDGTKYASHLPSDGFDLVLSLIPGFGWAAKDGRAAAKSSERVISDAGPIEHKVLDEAKRVPVFKRAARSVEKMPHAARQGLQAIDAEAHHVVHQVVQSEIDRVSEGAASVEHKLRGLVEPPASEYRRCTVPLPAESTL